MMIINKNMLKRTLLYTFFFSFLRVVALSQLLITSSGEVNLGSFVKGGTYSVDPFYNEITYTISAIDSVERERTVLLYNTDSDFGSDTDVKLTTEWIVDINTPFVNGGEYKFKGFLKVKVKVKYLNISQNAISGSKREFTPRLIIEEVRY
jgi:hypothetical protein